MFANNDAKGRVLKLGGNPADQASVRGWAIRCILKQFQEMYDDKLGEKARCIDKASSVSYI